MDRAKSRKTVTQQVLTELAAMHSEALSPADRVKESSPRVALEVLGSFASECVPMLELGRESGRQPER
jgi:hypothetical protein